ncbi:hypothetical protein OG921_21270 [Aldersonia sp. NBC_00410]|uniref:hypothetical protein n=1 Tax=Aldersonia sp. NBC_00410 TaxID=2975954 RepID=UPI00225B762B|nr:hypothetical protein [Aldersonia sp. NBC_00410]MCX5045700.1 hypothetical protein [Aldersonia sp. NBC_00410]
MDLADVTDELYSLDPSEFVAVRTARVKEAKAAGEKTLATEIGRLRKPTVVAWAVNTLARELPEEVAGLLQLGDALRDAQRHLSGADLRKLTGQRQQVVRAIAGKAGELAAERDHELGEGALREVGQTLHAALADPAVANLVRAGTLESAVSYSGFGPAGLSAVPTEARSDTDEQTAVETTTKRTTPRRTKADRSAKREAAERDLTAAKQALQEAQADLAAARTAADRARDDVDDIDRRIDELRDELDRAEQQRQFARTTERAASEAARKSERELERASRRVQKAQDGVDDLAD